MKNAIILVLSLTVIWFGHAIARLENQRYALELGICGGSGPENIEGYSKRSKCLEKIEMRTSDFYNLIYGLHLL